MSARLARLIGRADSLDRYSFIARQFLVEYCPTYIGKIQRVSLYEV